MGILLAAVAGLLLGSFFNVVIWRLPRHESLVTPGSHCPHCSEPVAPYDNVPVLSWIVLRGRCRHCGGGISVRYPAVELGTAALTTAVALFLHSSQRIALGEILVLTLVPVALIDLEHRIIPNVILAPAAVAALIAGALTRPAGLPEQALAGVGAALFLLLFALAYPRGMGMGDVKLVGLLGLCLGRSVAVAILAALILGVGVGVGVMARVGVTEGRKTAVPFGPFLAAGAVIALFAGPPVVHWYLHSVL
ncbi:A24 family peptidase [Conexibacter sp. DBS9H8]|uniref:prepilin peptidase n=1 Tax=Conexibacter sp. DBS9H8 TaxID=2937801 RepID=UPI00200DA691|nr:A24 family peptidase [Conexibacter sp. DBS9H8]